MAPITHHRDELLDNLREMETKIDDKFTKKFASNTSQVDHLARTIENNERMAKLKNVVLKGIPSNHKENLVIVFDQISLAIGFETKSSAVDIIIRSKKGSNQITSPILVKFVSAIMKRDFMTKYYTHRDLKLSGNWFGYRRPYISDNLTKRNFEIQMKAVKMLKKKKNSKIHTRSGLVHVKFSGVDKFSKILNLDDLNVMSRDTNENTVEHGE